MISNGCARRVRRLAAALAVLFPWLLSPHLAAQSPTTRATSEIADPGPTPVAVLVNGEPILPTPGTAAGIWFYSDPRSETQVLLAGHAAVRGSWQLVAAVGSETEVQLSVEQGSNSAQLSFTAETSPASSESSGLVCRAEPGGLVLKSGRAAGVARLKDLALDDRPVALAPRRRPLSRGPAPGSPDPHPAIAEFLIEWDWRLQDGIQTPREPRSYREACIKVLRRTEALLAYRRAADDLPMADRIAWDKFQAARVPSEQDEAGWEERWLQLHRLRRQFLLGAPVFKLPPLVAVKHVPSIMSHQLTQAYGYCARPGGGLFLLSEPGRSMRTRDITPPGFAAGNFMTPELSFDAGRLLFAYCPVREAPAGWDYNEQTRQLRYHIHELSLASGKVRALTEGDTDNFSPVVLPSGDVLFVSTRRGGFHRCGRGPCFVYTLSRMDAAGGNARTVSFHETHEWDPALLNDGRVVYTRWDYVDRNAVHYQQLWSCLPDGGAARIFFGNNTWNPTGIWEARPIPGSSRIMATAAPHHGMSAGSVVMVDTSRGVDGQTPLTRLTPEVRFPESESPLAFGPSPTACEFDTPPAQFWQAPLVEPGRLETPTEEENRWPGHCYKSPWPLSEKCFIVSYSYDRLLGEPGPNLPNMFGLYFADAFGNKELIYRDPAISTLWARPLNPRTPPPELASPIARADDDSGTFFLSNVTDSWPQIPASNRVAHLRIIQVLLKTTPNADAPRVGAAFAAPGKQVLGTVPVEPDGSALFRVPARTPVLFQALDDRGRALQTMRSLVYLQPGETQSCVGCHEQRLQTAATQAFPLALRRAPSRIHPGPEGSRPFSYPRLVQPVLDRHCVACHDGKEPNRPVLTGEPEAGFTRSYNALISRVSFSAWNRPQQNFEPLTEPLRFGAAASPLVHMLDQGHGKLVLPPEDAERLYTWIDANALFYGTFDVTEQSKQLAGEPIIGPEQ